MFFLFELVLKFLIAFLIIKAYKMYKEKKNFIFLVPALAALWLMEFYWSLDGIINLIDGRL